MSWCNRFSCWRPFWWTQTRTVCPPRSCAGKCSIRLKICSCFVSTSWPLINWEVRLCSCWWWLLIRIQVWLLMTCLGVLQTTSFAGAARLSGSRFPALSRWSHFLFSAVITGTFSVRLQCVAWISIRGLCSFWWLQLLFSWDLEYSCLLRQLALQLLLFSLVKHALFLKDQCRLLLAAVFVLMLVSISTEAPL